MTYLYCLKLKDQDRSVYLANSSKIDDFQNIVNDVVAGLKKDGKEVYLILVVLELIKEHGFYELPVEDVAEVKEEKQ